jgi:hypothetical protein
MPYYDNEQFEQPIENETYKFSRFTAMNNIDNRANNKNYDKYSIVVNKVWTNGKYYGKVHIENFGSGQQGDRIKNAVTGERTRFAVGSSDEDLFFKVSEASRKNVPLVLFYDSPEQYENHHFTAVNDKLKESWNLKHANAVKKYTVTVSE